MVSDTVVVMYETEDDVVEGVAVMTVRTDWVEVVPLVDPGLFVLVMVSVVLEMTMIEKLEVVELEDEDAIDVYGTLESTFEVEVDLDAPGVGVITEEDRVEVTRTVVPLMTVTVLVVVVDRLALLRIAEPTTDDDDDDDDDDLELPKLLVAVDKPYLDEVVLLLLK
jgi:hypothetical protein